MRVYFNNTQLATNENAERTRIIIQYIIMDTKLLILTKVVFLPTSNENTLLKKLKENNTTNYTLSQSTHKSIPGVTFGSFELHSKKMHKLFGVVENSIERCFATNIV